MRWCSASRCWCWPSGCGLGWTGTRKPPGCKQQAKTGWAIGQRVGCRNVTLRRAGRIITRVPAPKSLGEGAAFRPGVDPDNPRRCLHELFETTDHRLLGSARTNHRHSLHRRGWQNAKDRAAQFASVPTRMKPATVSTSGVLSYRRRRLRASLPERVFHCKCLDLHAGIEDAPSRRIWSRATVT
jgi:hypothetical protein